MLDQVFVWQDIGLGWGMYNRPGSCQPGGIARIFPLPKCLVMGRGNFLAWCVYGLRGGQFISTKPVLSRMGCGY